MNLLALFRRRRADTPADTARERLNFLLAHERVDRAGPDYLPLVKREILEVLAKYVEVEGDEVEVRLTRRPGATVIEVNVLLPAPQPVVRPAVLRVAEPVFAR
jgi:cell division topological specificity factor